MVTYATSGNDPNGGTEPTCGNDVDSGTECETVNTENRERPPIPVVLSEALQHTGFLPCEWEPDETACEKCNKQHVQMYFGNPSYWDCREGDYWCAECVIKMYQQYTSIEQSGLWLL